MNKADIDEMIKWFATYCSEPLEFGASHNIENTGMKLDYKIIISSNQKLECIKCGEPITIHDEVYDGKCSDCRKLKR